MGHARPKPQRLAEKLRQIRMSLGVSQPEMLRLLGVEDIIAYHRISECESDKREPLLTILLQYARLAGVNMEALVDDELELPEKIPGDTRHEEIRRKYLSRVKRRR